MWKDLNNELQLFFSFWVRFVFWNDYIIIFDLWSVFFYDNFFPTSNEGFFLFCFRSTIIYHQVIIRIFFCHNAQKMYKNHVCCLWRTKKNDPNFATGKKIKFDWNLMTMVIIIMNDEWWLFQISTIINHIQNFIFQTF